MNDLNMLTDENDPLQTYQRCLWTLSIGGIVLIFFFLSWLSIQHAEVLVARAGQHAAEQEIVSVRRQGDTSVRERIERIRILNEKLSKAEAARLTAEQALRGMAVGPGKFAVSPQVDAGRETPPPTPAEASGPNSQELVAFIKTHLSHMTESVEAQLPDYAEEVDFHDKPRASLVMIENDRRQLGQKFPVRSILKDEVQPQFSAVRDARYGWMATATFDWRWVYRSRSGALTRGITRDIWKIVPTAQGLKIVSEHSTDPMTGASKD